MDKGGWRTASGTRGYRTPWTVVYSATEVRNTGHRGQRSAEPIARILISRCSNDYFNSGVIDEEKERHGMPHNER